MKKFFTTLTLTAGVSLLPSISHAQEYPGCFRVNIGGQYTDLNSICLNSGQDTSLARELQIPIKRREAGIPVVDATFNSQKTFEVLFDTGASTISLTPQMASELKLTIEGQTKVDTAGGIVTATTSRVTSVRAGNLTVRDLEVTVSPSLPIGLLGQNFYGDYDVTIRENVVELRRR